jgi:hypothetical protein
VKEKAERYRPIKPRLEFISPARNEDIVITNPDTYKGVLSSKRLRTLNLKMGIQPRSQTIGNGTSTEYIPFGKSTMLKKVLCHKSPRTMRTIGNKITRKRLMPGS